MAGLVHILDIVVEHTSHAGGVGSCSSITVLHRLHLKSKFGTVVLLTFSAVKAQTTAVTDTL